MLFDEVGGRSAPVEQPLAQFFATETGAILGAALAIHGRGELQKVGRVVQARARASLMSDTKWRKLFAEINNPERNVSYCLVKFIDAPREFKLHIPLGLDTPRPWAEMFYESDLGAGFGPTPLSALEWVLVPRVIKDKRGNAKVPDSEREQDVEAIKAALDRLGKYPAQLSDKGLLITGHVA